MDTDKQQNNPNKSIYLLPNLFTTGSLFFGFFAIISAVNNRFEISSMAIFISAILDTLDGRVARLTNTQSDFGAEYDSLADLVAFGIAPALVMYFWALDNLKQIGWLIAFMYVTSVALRLARFNSQLDSNNKRYFFGLPCPSAACVLAGLVWVGQINQFSISMFQAIIFAIIVFYLSGMMVSSIKFRSFKDYDLKGKVGYATVVCVVVIYAAIAYNPAHILFIFFLIYALSGPAALAWCKLTGKKQHNIKEENKDKDSK